MWDVYTDSFSETGNILVHHTLWKRDAWHWSRNRFTAPKCGHIIGHIKQCYALFKKPKFTNPEQGSSSTISCKSAWAQRALQHVVLKERGGLAKNHYQHSSVQFPFFFQVCTYIHFTFQATTAYGRVSPYHRHIALC